MPRSMKDYWCDTCKEYSYPPKSKLSNWTFVFIAVLVTIFVIGFLVWFPYGGLIFLIPGVLSCVCNDFFDIVPIKKKVCRQCGSTVKLERRKKTEPKEPHPLFDR
ncbi:MAG: hypothetical protein ACFFBI_07690 [Promethearchaeota archaeon]